MFFWIARFVMWIGMHVLYRCKVSGVENIPEEGGFVLCANHIHAMDPVMLAVSVKRRLYFMAKKELFEHWFTGPFLRSLGAFPVDRQTTDMRSYRHALDILRDGKGLLVFSQGTRMKELSDMKGGAALFSLKTDAPIVPVGISGTYKRFSSVHIKIGKPVPMETYRGLRVKTELIDDIMNTVTTQVRELTL